MSLSVLCPTRDPGPRVRALLEPLRAIADEIIVAVDSRAPLEHLSHYAAVADRVLRFERGPRHSALAWLHAQCRCDWILLLAGDEVVSGDLLEALPELIARRDAQQVSFSLRWLWPTPDRWLSGVPWYPGFQTRLMRNDGTLRFRGLPHELAVPTSPARFLDLPIWHLSLLVSEPDARRAKVEANVAERAGLTAAGGGELNAAFYLPEDRADPPTHAVQAADRARIEAVLQARGPSRSVPAVPVAGRAVIDPLWSGREIPAGVALRCAVGLLDAAPLRMRRGEARTLYARVRNDGPEPWAWGLGGLPPFRLGLRWQGEGMPGEVRGALPCDVPVGDEAIVPITVTAPERPGHFTFDLDMLLEHQRWFDCPLQVAVDVVD